MNTLAPKNQDYSRILLKFYPDEAGLIAQKDSLNLLYPDYYETEDVGSRFLSGTILTPDFIGAFLNTERLQPGARSIIASILGDAFKVNTLGLAMVKNPFFTDTSIVNSLSGSLDSELQKVGFFRKKALNTVPATALPTQTPTGTGVMVVPKIGYNSSAIPSQIVLAASTATALRFIDTPSKQSTLEVVAREEILIAGYVPSDVTGVFINNYRLKSFTQGSGRFTYRARKDLGNLRIGTNIYTLAFEKNGKKEIQESLQITNLSTARPPEPIKVTESSTPATPAVPVIVMNLPPKASNVLLVDQTGSIQSGATISSTGVATTNTGTSVLVPTPVITPPPVMIKDDHLLYLANGTPAKLVIKTISPRSEVLDSSKKAVELLKSIGFTVTFEEIENSPTAITEAVKGASKNYDILITGVNLGFLGTYVSPYFHSGQAQNGYNFGLLRNPSLDVLLEELRTRDLSIENRVRIFEKINEILKKESVLVPFGTTPLNYFIDTNVRDFRIPRLLPSAIYIDTSILPSYLKKTYVIQFEKKSIR